MELRLSLSGEDPSSPALEPFTGVGLIRGEFILRQRRESLAQPEARDAIAAYVETVAKRFAPRPVWYRLTDLWSDEASLLAGAEEEAPEKNPMLGVRGCRRATADVERLRHEVTAVSHVAQDHSNLTLILPFIQDADEFARVQSLAVAMGWPNAVGAMVEVPSAVIGLADILAAGAHCLLVGMNDLSCLLLGQERGGPEMKEHPALWWAIARVGEVAGHKVPWGVAGSMTPNLLPRLADAKVPFASLHYAELTALAGVDPDLLPDRLLVQFIKQRDRKERERRRQAVATASLGG